MVKPGYTRDLKSLGRKTARAGSSPARGTKKLINWILEYYISDYSEIFIGVDLSTSSQDILNNPSRITIYDIITPIQNQYTKYKFFSF